MRSLLKASGHLGKEATKFQFDLTIEGVQGLHTGPHTIKWTRGAKVAYTKPFQVERRSKENLLVGQKISLLCTLYRSKNRANGTSYDAKDSKISLVSLKDGKKNEKTIGKVHFNIAEYAGVPSAEASVKFKLNSKVRVEVRIACTFVQVSKGTGSSVGSGLSGLTVSSGEPEQENEDPSEEDFGEDLNGIFSPTTPEPQTPFQCAQAVFSSVSADKNGENTADADPVHMTVAFRKFSSTKTEKQWTGPNTESEIEQGSGTASTSRSLSSMRSNRKSKLGTSENDNEGLRPDLVRCRKDLKKCKQLNKVSEEVIVELRQALSKNELELKNAQVKQTDALKRKTVEVNEDITSIEMRATQEAENYEERLTALRIQVESIGRAKQRAEEELLCIRAERNALEKGLPGSRISEFEPDADIELKKLKADCDFAESKLTSELARRHGLEQKCEDLHKEVFRLRSKVLAYEEHSEQSKQTYEDLSTMYSELRVQHTRVQQELEQHRDGPGNVVVQNSGERTNSERSRFRLRRNKTEQVRREESNESPGEEEILRMSLHDAKTNIILLQTKKSDSDRRCLSLSADLDIMKDKLAKSQCEGSKLSKEYELMKTKFFETCEKLEDCDRKSYHLERKLMNLGDISLISRSFNSQTERTNNTDLSQATQHKIMKVATAALEAKRTIQKMRVDLQEAYDREKGFETEIRRLQRIVEESTHTVRMAFDGETARREELERELQKALSGAETTKSSLEAMIEKEVLYREEINDLESAFEGLQENVDATRDSNNIALSAVRQDLKVKQAELQTASLRIESLERELSSKREIAENLSTRARELEIESQIMKGQALHELELAKEATKQVEASRTTESIQAENYKTEIASLKAVAENLEIDLQRSLQNAEVDVKNAQLEANENRILREEAEEKNLYLDSELKRQRGVVESLQKRLQEAVEQSRKAAEESADEARRKLKALEEKGILQEDMQANVSKLRERELKISELTDRLEAITSTLEDSKRASEKVIEKTTARLKEKERFLVEALEKQKELNQKVEEQAARVSQVQSELTLALKKNLELSSNKTSDDLENRGLQQKLIEAEERLGKKQKSIDTLRNKGDGLEGELSEMKETVHELQEMVATLRTTLTDSQNKLVALTAASAADSRRTSAELEEARSREETFREDISKNVELIEDLRSKLTAAVGRNATESALAQAELSEVLDREESYKEELKQRKHMLEDLEDELMNLKSSSAFASANIEADLTEALCREENYRFELKRLKGIIKDMETKLEQEKETVQKMKNEKARGNQYGDSGSSRTILQGVEAKTAAGMRADQAMAEVLGLGGESLSSSNIRKLDVFEKITDARLLEMLVETKMQLALAEEEKLQLEHLIRRIRDGDKHVQQKVAQQASRLELKLTKANQMVDSMQDDRSRELSRQESERSGSGAVARQRSVMKGDQLQFFRDQRRDKKSRTTKSEQRAGMQSKKSSAPADEWDIGDDSHDGAQSTGDSQSRESSFSENSSATEYLQHSSQHGWR